MNAQSFSISRTSPRARSSSSSATLSQLPEEDVPGDVEESAEENTIENDVTV